MICSITGFPVHHKLLETSQTHVHQVIKSCPTNLLILCCPLLLPPSIFPSIRVFSNESVLRIRWPKYCSFSISNSPSNEYSELISFRMDWLDLLAVQGTCKSLLQHHSSKASILWRSAFFIVQLSHPYMTTGKTIALTRQTFVGKATSLLFNMLSKLVIKIMCDNLQPWQWKAVHLNKLALQKPCLVHILALIFIRITALSLCYFISKMKDKVITSRALNAYFNTNHSVFVTVV